MCTIIVKFSNFRFSHTFDVKPWLQRCAKFQKLANSAKSDRKLRAGSCGRLQKVAESCETLQEAATKMRKIAETWSVAESCTKLRKGVESSRTLRKVPES